MKELGAADSHHGTPPRQGILTAVVGLDITDFLTVSFHQGNSCHTIRFL